MPAQSTNARAIGPRVEREAHRRDDVLVLLGRATFGFTPDDAAHARALGAGGWLDEQLAPQTIDDSALEARLAAYPMLGMDGATLFATYPPSINGDATVSRSLVTARILRAALSNRQLFERVVEFWTDHFNIDGFDDAARYTKTIDDRDVIRAYALGTFRELLGASARSGAMLHYLDNDVNTASAPNENYARELLELHTVGVDGGYTETDVVEVARCFTGWSTPPPGDPGFGSFAFLPGLHDDGPKTVLGAPIPAGGGVQDGETVLDLLAASPSTAAFVARKLCVYFLVHDPPAATVQRVAARFTATGGDLAATVREVLRPRSMAESRAADPETKLRRPFHLAMGALRVTGATIGDPAGLFGELFRMGHVPFAWQPPDGYPDTLEAWGSGVLARWGFLARLLGGQVPGAHVPNAAILGLVGGVPVDEVALALGERLTGGRIRDVDRSIVQAFVDGRPAWNAQAAREAIALTLSLPSSQFF
ncbi:MAG: DUF1800 domain-containing protein [Planctomycetota bacterium]